MKRLGIIGGLGPESTIEYYHFLVDAYRERTTDGSYPHIVINSVDLNTVRDRITTKRFDELIAYLVEELERLAAAKMDFALIAANSPHVVFDEVRRQSPLPLISIVEATCRGVLAHGLKRPALFGTKFTMQGRFYPDVFAPAGIDLVVPAPDEQTTIHDIYMNELLNGSFRPESKSTVLAIAERMKARDGIDAVILGGTELPLLLREDRHAGLPLLDTTKLHVAAAIEYMLS